MPLGSYVESQKVGRVAELLGCTDDTIHKAKNSTRAVWVIQDDGGNLVEAFEVKPFPSGKGGRPRAAA